jgi:hypothetical protein
MDKMTTKWISNHNLYFAATEGPSLACEQDALDLLGEIYGTEADVIVVPVHRFSPGFFDLSNRQAGHFFQKMQNYRIRLFVVGDISGPMKRSKALSDFVGETNRIGYHLFAADRVDMEARLDRRS